MAGIACKRCVKACEQGAIEIVNNVATIDYSKCIGCGACAEVCPSHCMTKDEILINVEKSKFELDRKAQRELQRRGGGRGEKLILSYAMLS